MITTHAQRLLELDIALGKLSAQVHPITRVTRGSKKTEVIQPDPNLELDPVPMRRLLAELQDTLQSTQDLLDEPLDTLSLDEAVRLYQLANAELRHQEV